MISTNILLGAVAGVTIFFGLLRSILSAPGSTPVIRSTSC